MVFSCLLKIVNLWDRQISVYLITADGSNDSVAGDKSLSTEGQAISLRGIVELNQFLQKICLTPSALVFFMREAYDPVDESYLENLANALDEDPLFGFAMPRIACQGEFGAIKQVVMHLPPSESRIVEGAPVLVRTSVIRDFGLLDERAQNLDSALVRLFMRANRRGFSARLVNTVVFQQVGALMEGQDVHIINDADYAKAIASQALLPEVRFERLLRHRFLEKAHRELLVDIRNLSPGFNGTAHHVLALLGPLSCLSAQRGIKPFFWALPESAEFHRLSELYGDSVIHQLAPGQYFDASIRLSQPWSMSELKDQAYISTVNVFSVLDTIAWDCHYIRMPHIEAVWRAMAQYADGLTFISDFSSARFFKRFPPAKASLSVSAKCSMDPAEYWPSDLDKTAIANQKTDQSYILIVGNRYYHKGLSEVVTILSTAFPLQHFKVLGEFSGAFHNVEQIPSGAQSEKDVASLFANCICLIFPSFYEGFGLPIFEALAFGKPVLARHSELIDEINEHISHFGCIQTFNTTNQLLRGLKSILKVDLNNDCLEHPSSDLQVYRWEDSASDILNLLETLLNRQDFSSCRERLEFFYRLDLFDIERAGWADATQNMVCFEFERME